MADKRKQLRRRALRACMLWLPASAIVAVALKVLRGKGRAATALLEVPFSHFLQVRTATSKALYDSELALACACHTPETHTLERAS
jgi:hypothetical protein